MATKYHVNPKMRAYGKARIDITKRAKDEKDWQENWREQLYFYPFEFAEGWKTCFEYKVDDFAAEVGFYMDFLGFPSSAFSPSYAQFTSPDGDFFIGVSAVDEGGESTPPDALRLQFNILDLFDTIDELESRGIVFEGKPQPVYEDSDILVTTFRTPHGISIDLWGSDEISPSVIGVNETAHEFENTTSDELDENMEDEEIDDYINDLLYPSGDDETEDDSISDGLDMRGVESTGKPDREAHTADEGIRKTSDRSRFPHSFEKYNLNRSENRYVDQDGISQNDDKSDKIGLNTLSQSSDPEDNELSYQEIDE
jgi:hypothetical protein